ncbi:NACHT domain-containing protein [Adhaeribacter soli]|uniref:NACHT domain-containing protein n=1 Tax=Adhaeribacter soli TaxID=2607655 RepID=A0A5N1IHB4_9BACT|nr:NACHT domain-containing protein [Adhaeribacter soli]KAA9325045.1 NACHT domain-containing protein [Adhaeribacter soli]
MDESTATGIKDVLTIAKPILDPVISALIAPKIERLKAWIKKQDIKDKVIDNTFENKFAEYLGRTYSKAKQINILIFPGLQIDLQEIYEPLSINSKIKKVDSRGKRSISEVTLRLDSFKEEHIDPFQKILISDSAGMGKSTLTKWICLQTLESSLAIPILIELRNLTVNHSILDEIFDQLNPIDQIFDRDLIVKFLELGQFLIILDGFDELPYENNEVIIKDLRKFIDRTDENWFIMTSRPEGALSAFGDFQLFNIRPLRLQEAFNLIRKYDEVSPLKVGESLIKNIETRLTQVHELLANPFLVSLLYSVYAFNKDIPDDKVTFYEEIYSALYKKHDLSKNGWTRPKKSKLSLLQFRILLRQLAFDTARKGSVSYSESVILDLIDIAKGKCAGINTNAEDFLDDLLKAVPLFQREGHKIKWGHKSIQDFFSSDFITYSSKKENILNWILETKQDGFLNILDFYIEQDFITFRKVIIYQLLKDFVRHYETSYNNISQIPQDEINIRRTLTYDLEVLFTKENSALSSDEIEDFASNKIKGYNEGLKNGYYYPLPSNLTQLDALVINSFKSDLLHKIVVKVPTLKYLKIKDTGFEERPIHFNLPVDQIYEVNDDPTNPINSILNFEETNSLLMELGPFAHAYFSYPDAKAELRRIELELANDKKANDLNDF